MKLSSASRGWRVLFGVMRVGAALSVFACLWCAHVISEKLRGEVEPSLTFAHVFQTPSAFVGKKIILGGVIVKTVNFPDRAEIEVVQKEIDSYGNLARSDMSGGRFIFSKPGFLEPEIYSKGREVTGAGKIAGTKPGKVDDREYRYPVIEVEELYLWEREEYPRYPLYGDPFWYPYYHYPWRYYPYYW